MNENEFILEELKRIWYWFKYGHSFWPFKFFETSEKMSFLNNPEYQRLREEEERVRKSALLFHIQ